MLPALGIDPLLPTWMKFQGIHNLGTSPPHFFWNYFVVVCAQFRLLGWKALGVDDHLKRTKLKSAAVKLDLTQPWVQELITREVELGRISAVHLGPPCGTASKARCIPVKRKLRKKGAPNPKPLRSKCCPLGFPWLKGISRAKVLAANALYEFSAKLVCLCDKHQIPFTVENPENSLMWSTPFFKPRLKGFLFMWSMLVNMVQNIRRRQVSWPILRHHVCNRGAKETTCTNPGPSAKLMKEIGSLIPPRKRNTLFNWPKNLQPLS